MAKRRKETIDKTCGYMTPFESSPSRSNGVKVISFFAGAGGLDLGFHQAGFDVQYCSDIEPLFCESLKANWGTFVSSSTRIESVDIRKLRAQDLPSNPDLVIGGPPCQSFSASGRRAGGAAGGLDARGTLFGAYRDLIDQLKPAAFLFENVRGIFGTNGGKDWKDIQAAFSKIGYNLSFRILDACDYGSPQHRERLFMVGNRVPTEFLFPKPTHGPDSADDSPHMIPETCLANVDHMGEDLEGLRLTGGKYCHLLPEVPPGDNYLFFTAKRGYSHPKFAYRSRFSDFLYKANPSYPIKTLIASPGKYTGPLHWDNRYFSLAEYKRLQGFPDSYKFCGNRSDVIRQIGNSVSPPIALQLARAIGKQFFNIDYAVQLLTADESLSFDKRKGRKATKTRNYHKSLSDVQSHKASLNFELDDYAVAIEPNNVARGSDNVRVRSNGKTVQIKVRGDKERRLFAKMELDIHGSNPGLLLHESDSIVRVLVSVYGTDPLCVQTMWNAVDDWVIRSSNFHSLFEMYGHFTEPHPIFRVSNFEALSEHPIVKFAKHIANFDNCSRYFPKKHLIELFGRSFNTSHFAELATILRSFRFDVRSHETNIAIPKGVFTVCYPFTLPKRKQMNFSIKNEDRSLVPAKGSVPSYIDFVAS